MSHAIFVASISDAHYAWFSRSPRVFIAPRERDVFVLISRPYVAGEPFPRPAVAASSVVGQGRVIIKLGIETITSNHMWSLTCSETFCVYLIQVLEFVVCA